MNHRNRRFSRGPWLPVVVLVAAMLLVFGKVGGYAFLMYDDEPHLLDNPRLNPVSWQGVGAFWTESSYWGLYIPLSYTFFGAEAALSGQPLNPAVFHLGNLALHVACVLLVFGLLRRLFHHNGAACAGALLFGLHPVQVESVAWISEARGLLSAMFSLLALWMFDVWAAAVPDLPVPPQPPKSPKSPHAPNRKKSPGFAAVHGYYYAAATGALILALLSKPAAVAVPLIAVLLTWGLQRRPARRIAAGVGPWLILAVGWIVQTKLQQPSGRMPFVAPLWARPLIAGDAMAFYLAKLLGPIQYLAGLGWHLLLAPWQGLAPLGDWARPLLYGPDYGRTPQWVVEHRWSWLSWTAPAGLLVVLACLRNRRVWLSAAGISVAWLLPVLGLVPFDFQRISTVADRYLYVAMLGPALATAWLLAHHWNRWTIGVTAGVCCLLAGLSFVQTSHWRDNATLIEYSLRVNPHGVLAMQQRGVMLSRAGDHQAAMHWYREAIRLHPHDEAAYLSLAKTLVILDRADEAERVLREGLRQVPARPVIPFTLANLLVEQGAIDEAVALYRKALEIDPEYDEAHLNLALALERQKKYAEAEEQFARPCGFCPTGHRPTSTWPTCSPAKATWPGPTVTTARPWRRILTSSRPISSWARSCFSAARSARPSGTINKHSASTANLSTPT